MATWIVRLIMNNRKVSTALLCAGVLGAAGVAWRPDARKHDPAPITQPVQVTTQELPIDAESTVSGEGCPYVEEEGVSGEGCPYVEEEGVSGEGCPYVEEEGGGNAPYATEPELANIEGYPHTPLLQNGAVQGDQVHQVHAEPVAAHGVGMRGGGMHPQPGSMHGASRPEVVAPQPGEILPVSGPLGATIQALHAQRTGERHPQVRVRGRVVRVIEGVMGTNFVHLRDGTGSDANGDADLTATMAEVPALGETIVVEGTLISNRDVGTGFVYRALLDEATRVED
jgi:hypothetical protein